MTGRRHPSLPESREATESAQIRLDTDGRIVDWNAAAAQVTGLTADAAVGRHLASLSVDDGPWAARVEQQLHPTTDRPQECREWVWHSDGTRRSLAVTVTPASDGFRASLRDLTPRRLHDNRAAALYGVGRAALDARDVDDLAQRILAAMCDALDWEIGVFWKVDRLAGTLRCRRIVRLAEDKPRGLAYRDVSVRKGQGLAGTVWAADRPETAVTGFADHPVFSAPSLKGQLRTAFAFPVKGRDGMLGVFELASRAVEQTGPELQRTAAIIGNHVSQLSDRFRAEHALRESAAQKAAILSNALDGIIQVDTNGRVIEVNPEAARTFAFESLAMLGRDLAEFLAEPDDRDKLRDTLSELCDAAGSDAMGRRLQVRARRATGEEFPADLAVTRVALAGPPHFGICLRDVSEQERLQEALHHAQKMESLGVLASGIAHDFYNFLTVIRGQAERLVKHLTEDDDRRRWVTSILKVSERGSALTRQLLAFGRREAGKIAVVDVNAVVESTASLLSQQLGDRVSWHTSLAPDAGPARVGEGQVQQILFNLALNAIDAMPDGGTLTVETANEDLSPTAARRLLLGPGPYVRLTVRDTGRGMDARTQSRVFEPFFTTKRLGDGTGLGLSTVYAIVQQCGGQVTLSSRVGRGTTFDLYFPRVTTDWPVALEARSGAPDQALAGMTVLLVEDEDEIREIIRDSLEERGCRVLICADSTAALELCARHDGPIHLLLTDMMMPGMNGHELAERIVRLRPATPVMFVSGHPEAEVGDDTLIGRHVTLLRKPFSSDELVDRVIEVVGSSVAPAARSA